LEVINGHNVHDTYESSEIVLLDAAMHKITVSCQVLQGAIKGQKQLAVITQFNILANNFLPLNEALYVSRVLSKLHV